MINRNIVMCYKMVTVFFSDVVMSLVSLWISKQRTKSGKIGTMIHQPGIFRYFYVCICQALLHNLFRVQELCESRGGRPGLPSLISLRFPWT